MRSIHKQDSRYSAGGCAAAVILAILLLSAPSVVLSQMRMNSPDAPFELSISQRIDRERGTYLRINATVDYRQLIFFKKPGGYEAAYRVYLNIKEKKNDRVRGEVWEESASAASYNDTKSISLKSVIKKDFPIGAGDFRVEMIIEMLGSSRKLKREIDVRIVATDSDAIMIEMPLFLQPGRADIAGPPPKGELRISPCDSLDDGFDHIPGAVFMGFDSWIRVFFGLLPPSGQDSHSQCSLSIRVSDPGGRVLFYNKQSVETRPGEYRGYCADINVDDLDIGVYDFSISGVICGTGIKTERNGSFTVLLNRGLLGGHFSKMIELLSLVADDDELDVLREAPETERLNEWNRFWKERDPTPQTALNEELSEYLVRLRYALRTFSKYRPGWKTDMGRVYIRYGRPDRMLDQSGAMSSYGSEYQLWYYDSMGMVYIFRNSLHGGEYRLVESRMY
ncbi:MAG: GWxTD domain-containing protein [Candidatus Krumholzibacteriota bacterium]|nr:GWxTD domain-containing protein [Candidatus Krumholzibacteriota bacterium]